MKPQDVDSTTHQRPHSPAWFGWLLPLGFLAVAAGLLAAPRLSTIPIPPASFVAESDLVVAPRRSAMTDPPRIKVEGVTESCNACHQIFKSAHPARTAPSFHTDIRLRHGLNDRCVNCHDAENRERLTLRDGTSIPFADTPQLCSQCHGTVFRDWQRGTHGKTLGSWVTNSPDLRRLNCNECHDPHSPRYEPYTPLPGPDTLRMGSQSRSPHHGQTGRQSPLQHWLHAPENPPVDQGDQSGGHP